MTHDDELPARLRAHTDRYVAADPIAAVSMQFAKDVREAAAALERAGSRPANPMAGHENDEELPARLIVHANLHQILTSPYDEEQRCWERDLRAAAAEIERRRKAVRDAG